MTQPWLAASFAVIVIATAAYCGARLALSWRQGRPTDRTVDAVHVLMGVAMAGMLVPRLRVGSAAGWEALFAAAVALFLWRLARPARPVVAGTDSAHRLGHDIQHLLGCGAMVYMLTTMTARSAGRVAAAGGMSGAAGASALALVLAVALLGCVVWSADRISTLAPVAVLAGSAHSSGGTADPGLAPAGTGAGPPLSPGSVPLSPRLAACCEVAMGITMGYMLIALA